MKELTKAEEQVMQVMWERSEISVKEIIEHLPEPKPAINTISTIVRILEKKGFVDHVVFGKGYKYFTIVSKREYTKKFLRKFVSSYFDDSFKSMVSFFVKENRIDLQDMEELLKEIKKDDTTKQ